MGVKQLTTYVKDHFGIFYKEEFRLRGQKLVFDGGALYYGLIRSSDKRFGGDYNILYNTFKRYLLQLRGLGVTPYIVLDGGSNIPLKNTTICERFDRDVRGLRNLSNLSMSQMNLPKPLFLKMVFVEVLNELGINFVLAKGEADLLVAALANRLDCPLVSGDSDFFVINVTQGVIPMDAMLFLKTNMQTISRFRSIYLLQHLRIHLDLLPFIAIIMGNDYSEEAMLHKIQTNSGVKNNFGTVLLVNDRLKRIGEYLNRFQSIDDVTLHLSRGDQDLKIHIESVLKEFDLKSVDDECNELFPILLNTKPVSEMIIPLLNPKVPLETFLKLVVYHGLGNPCLLDIHTFSTHFIRTQCEDISQKVAAAASEKLRTYLYVILLHEKSPTDQLKISEFKRSGDRYEECSIHVSVQEWVRYHPINIFSGNYSKTDKIRILCGLTGFPMQHLNTAAEAHHLLLISIRYWIQESSDAGRKLKISHVQALVICFIQLMSASDLSCTLTTLDAEVMHHYCRWKSILFYLILLNIICRYPFVTLKLSRLCNGSVLHFLYGEIERGVNPYTLLSKNDQQIYNVFMNVVTENMTSCLTYKQQNRPKKRERSDERVPPNNPQRQDFNNRYALLNNDQRW